MLMKTQLITFVLVLGIPLCGLAQRNATSPAPVKPSSTALQPRPFNGSDPGKNSTTPSGRPYREREDLPPGGSVFRMTQPPTFADHSEAAKAVEQTLPVQLPVAQMYNASPKLPGYLDATRSASFIMMDELMPSLPPAYATSDEMIAAHTEGKRQRSEYDERLKFLYAQDWNWPEQHGFGQELVWEYTSEGETWVRHETILGRWEEGGFHYINLMSFYPVRFKDRMRPEIEYYLKELIINPYQR